MGSSKQFNGNDSATMIALGTLDSISAGVLMWRGIMETNWLSGPLIKGELAKALAAVFRLLVGLLMMSAKLQRLSGN